MKKGQTALEYMLIIVVAMVVVAMVWVFAFNATDEVKEKTSGYTGGGDQALFDGDSIGISDISGSTITASEALRTEDCNLDSSLADECTKSGMWIQTNDGKTYRIVSFPSVGPDDFNSDTITCNSDIEGSPTSFKVYKNRPMSVMHYEYVGADCVSVAGYDDDDCDPPSYSSSSPPGFPIGPTIGSCPGGIVSTSCDCAGSTCNPGSYCCDGVCGSDECETCTDVDLDGFSPDGFDCGLLDCDDFDININPDAPELINGVDDNCNGLIDELPEPQCEGDICDWDEGCSISLSMLAEENGIDIGSAAYYATLDGNDEEYKETILREFTTATTQASMMSKYTNPGLGVWDFSKPDDVISFLEEGGLRVHGHPLVYHFNPPNYLNWEMRMLPSPEDLEDILYDHVTNTVTHYSSEYSDTLDTWIVVNEPLSNDQSGGVDTGHGFSLRDFTKEVGSDNNYWVLVDDYVDKSFVWARDAADDAGDHDLKLILNENHISLVSDETKFNALLAMIDYLKSKNTPIDGVGFQFHITLNSDFDKQTLKDRFAEIADRGLEVQITEMEVGINKAGGVTEDELAEQATVYKDAVEACLESSNCDTVVFWCFTDKYAWLPTIMPDYTAPCIFDADYNPKPAYDAIKTALLENLCGTP